MITGNKYVERQRKEKLTGLFDVKPIVLNPTKKELEEMGFNYEEEPNYLLKDDSGETEGVIIKLYLSYEYEGKTNILPTSVYLRNTHRNQSSSGNYKYIDNKLNSAWLDVNPNDKQSVADGVAAYNEKAKYGKFSSEYTREKIGEQQLYQLLAYASDTQFDDDFSVDFLTEKQWETLLSGDFSFLKKIVKKYTKNEFRMLLGINKEKKSQSWFDKNSAIGESPYLRKGQTPDEESKFWRFVLGKKRGDKAPGEYSWSHNFYLSSEPVVFKSDAHPDLTKMVSNSEEEPSNIDDSDMPF